MADNDKQEDTATSALRRRRRLIIAGGIVALVCILVVVIALVAPGCSTAYTDAGSIYLRQGDADVRNMVWQSVELFGGPVNDTPHNLGGGLSKTGHTLVFSRRLPKAKHADLFITRFDGEEWSPPRPLTTLNTDADELAPTLSRDGKRLYFHSNRPGGLGGYDIYSSHRSGRAWPRPINLGEKINSEFDECDPGLSADETELVFSSNRPKESLLPAERRTAWRKTMVERAGVDFDIFSAEDVIVPARSNPLRDTEYRKVIITRLGGSPETEKAVGAALKWLTGTQEANGSWSCGKHGGAAGHDNAATGFAALTYMGWGAKHTEKGPYQKPLANAIKWLAGRVGKDGSLTGGLSNGMYDHGIALIALAEAYELTNDPALLAPLERAVAFTVKAQNPSLGGWRYTPGSPTCDTSVVGWQVMALHSARRAGIDVPEKAFTLAAKWMDRVSTGKHRGLYGYSGPGKGAAVTAEGMFVRQLLGARPGEARQKESAAYVASQAPKPNATNPNLYLIYYGCLALYQQQGADWEKWNANVKPLLLKLQKTKDANTGAWHTGNYAGSTGRVISTALAALSLQVYYRYLPMVSAEPTGVAAVKKSTTKEVVKAVKAPQPPPKLVPLTARRVDALCSPGNDRGPAFTRYGDFLYFSSDRPGGHGGLDLYRCRVDKGGAREPENLGPRVNSASNDTDPTLASHGFELVFASDREVNGYKPTLLYRTVAREVDPVADAFIVVSALSFINEIKWWLLGVLAGGAGLVYLIMWFIKVSGNPETSRFAKCMAGSFGAHVLILVLLSVWMIGQTLTEEIVEPMQISVDANALANEKLALALREEMTPLESTPEMAKVPSDIKPTEIPDLKPAESSPQTMAESTFKVDPADLKANAKEIESLELAKRAEPKEPRRSRVKFKPLTITLERPAATRPKSEAERRELEVVVRPVRAESDPGAFTAAPPERFADPETMPRATSAPDASSPALIKPIDTSTTAVAGSKLSEESEVRSEPAATEPVRVRFAAAAKLESAQPRHSNPAEPTVTAEPAHVVEAASAQAEAAHSEAPSLRSTAQMVDATAALDAKPIASVQPAAASAVESQADSVAAAPSDAKAPSRVKFTSARFKLEAPSANRGATEASAQVEVRPAGTAGSVSERAEAKSELVETLKVMSQMADASAAPTSKPIGDVQAATAPAVEQQTDSVAATTSSVNAPSRVKFQPTNFKLEAPSANRSVAEVGAEVAVGLVGTAGSVSERAQVKSELDTALKAMGQMASVAVPMSNVRAGRPVLKAITSTDTDAVLSDGPARPPERQRRVKFTPAGLALEAPRPRNRPAGPDGVVGVEPSRVAAAGGISSRAGAEHELASSLGAPGAMARADLSSRGIRADNPVMRAMDYAEEGPGRESGQPARAHTRVRFKPSTVGLESPGPRRRSGGGTNVSVAPVRAGRVGPTQALAVGAVSGTLGSTAKMSESGIPNALASAVRGTGQARLADSDLRPDLSEPGRPVSRGAPRLRVRKAVVLEGPGDKPSDHLRLRDRGERSALLPQLGTSKEAEAGVKRALDWFTRHQEPDGRWSCRKSGGQDGHDNAATAFAILCYYGWGVKHTEKGGGEEDAALREPLSKAVTWLAGRVGKDGDLTGGLDKGMYDQGIGTMALAEAYGITRDEKLRAPLERAVGFIIKAQSKRTGGWRYKPGSGTSDTSVVGWQVMALMSARLAGLDVPEAAFDGAKRWFDRVATGHHRGRYGYSGRGAKHAMTAEAMFCQQLLGLPPFDPRMKESAEFIATKMPADGKPDYYYWYYGCLSLYQHQGPIWKRWNERMRPLLLESQVKRGDHAGSWAPDGLYGKYGGRVISTAMATLSLEVYYRYLPMYGLSNIAPEKKPDAKDGGGK